MKPNSLDVVGSDKLTVFLHFPGMMLEPSLGGNKTTFKYGSVACLLTFFCIFILDLPSTGIVTHLSPSPSGSASWSPSCWPPSSSTLYTCCHPYKPLTSLMTPRDPAYMFLKENRESKLLWYELWFWTILVLNFSNDLRYYFVWFRLSFVFIIEFVGLKKSLFVLLWWVN